MTPTPTPPRRTGTRGESAVLIRLTSEEHAILREAARRAGLGLGPWLRMLGLQAAKPVGR